MKRPSTGSGRPEPVEGRISLFARDLREKRDGPDMSSWRIAPVAHVLLVALHASPFDRLTVLSVVEGRMTFHE